MRNPNFLYITNGKPLSRRDYTLKFKDRTHTLRHWNQLPENYNLTDIGLCGLEFSKMCLNIEVPYTDFIYLLSRLRSPNTRQLTPEELESSFPIVAVAGRGELYLKIGNVRYTQEQVSELNRDGNLIGIYEDFWLTRSENLVK